MKFFTEAGPSKATGVLGRAGAVFGGLSRSAAVMAVSAAALLTVGAVLALGADTITLGGSAQANNWTSPDGPVDPPGPGDSLDLRVKTGPCDPTDDLTTYSDDPTFTMADVTLDLAAVADDGYGQAFAPLGTYCLHNASTFNGALMAETLGSISTEIGDCDVDEASQDTSCGDGDVGELDQVVYLEISGCDQDLHEVYDHDWDDDGIVDEVEVFSNAYWSEWLQSTSGYQFEQLDADETCELQIGLTTSHFSEQYTSYGTVPDPTLLAALSDSVTFDFAIALEEV